MPRLRQIARLFQAIGSSSLHEAEGIASEIAREEEKKGHHKAAQLLRGSLRPNSRTDFSSLKTVNGAARPLEVLSDALTPMAKPPRLSDIVLTANARTALSEIVREWTHSVELSSLGIQRRTKLFFFGPPGCGKSVTAQALGREMNLPTYVVRFDSVIGAYLGQTALHLRELFRFADTVPCVLVFDEVDALAKMRGNPLDVGELDRIVIAFMQELEHSHVKGLVVATSNLPKHLDLAVWRRFDLVLEFSKPNRSELRMFVRRGLQKLGITASVGQVSRICRQSSTYADAERAVVATARQQALVKIEAQKWRRKKAK